MELVTKFKPNSTGLDTFRLLILNNIKSWNKDRSIEQPADNIFLELWMIFVQDETYQAIGTGEPFIDYLGLIICNGIVFEPGVDKLLIQAQLGLELYLYNLFWGVWYRKVGFRFFKLKDWSYIEGLGNYILGGNLSDDYHKLLNVYALKNPLNLRIEYGNDIKVQISNLDSVLQKIFSSRATMETDLVFRIIFQDAGFLPPSAAPAIFKEIDAFIDNVKNKLLGLSNEIQNLIFHGETEF